MPEGIIKIELSEITERIDQIDQKVDSILQLLQRKQAVAEDESLVPQYTAIALLRTTHPTFKKWLIEFKIKEEKKGGRVFYKAGDVRRLMTGKK